MTSETPAAGDTRPEVRLDVARAIVRTIEQRFAELGATPQGLYWPKGEDVAVRYAVGLLPVLSALDKPRISVLDFGCGCGFLLDWLAANGLLSRVDYLGVDASAAILGEARRRWPSQRFALCESSALDAAAPDGRERFDAVVAFGIFTARFFVPEDEMRRYAETTLSRLWRLTESCLVFNAMSVHVDWTREDLFHWPIDDVVSFARRQMSRHVDVAGAYGLWEHTYRVWRAPQRGSTRVPLEWGE